MVRHIGGIALEDLVDRFDTPLLVVDGAHVESQVHFFTKALSHSPGGRLLYASKALSLTGVVARVHAAGSDIEVVSLGELATALKAGVSPDHVIMNGSPKSAHELDVAVGVGVTTFVLDAQEEIERLHDAVVKHDARAQVLIRYTPDEAPDTHRYVQTAGSGSKFGFLRDEVMGVLDQVRETDRLTWAGLHVHIGSNLTTIDAHLRAARDAFSLLEDIRQARGVTAHVLDLGGGFAAPKEGRSADVSRLVATVDRELQEKFGPERPAVWLEPGRSLIEGAGTLVYRALAVKSRPQGRVVLVDGGMGDNIRPALYDAVYRIAALPDRKRPSTPQEIYGRYCESGDRIGDLHAAPIEVGDLVLVLDAGAYTYSMASNYNRVGRPAVVWVEDGQATVLARREGVEDILSLDVPDAFPEEKLTSEAL